MLKKLPLARPLLGIQEERAVRRVLRSRWLVQGPRVAEFEESIRRFTRSDHAVAVSWCTSAPYLSLRADQERPHSPVSLEAEGTSMALPLFPEMSSADVDRVCRALRSTAT